jgi:hypothetical protein
MRHAGSGTVDLSLTRICDSDRRATDHRFVVERVIVRVKARCFAAMVAPHLFGLFCRQSDFGHPVGLSRRHDRFGLLPKSVL